MTRSKRKAGKISGILVGSALVAVVVVAGATTYLAGNRPAFGPENPKPPVTEQAPHRPAVVNSELKKETVDIFIIKTTDDESRLVAVDRPVTPGADKYHAAIAGLLEEAGTQNSAIPKGTRLRSLEISHELATVDLSKEFTDEFNGGSEDESLAIGAIVRTMAQFPRIKRVQILVDGKKVGTLGGHFELDEPIDVEAEPQNSGGTGE